MAPPRGSASYKKKDGTIALSENRQMVLWTPLVPPGGPSVLSLESPPSPVSQALSLLRVLDEEEDENEAVDVGCLVETDGEEMCLSI